ncbi:UNVERIFIED_CONTAM: hypothetical protein K2H54_055096 [Gekko kuhli]
MKVAPPCRTWQLILLLWRGVKASKPKRDDVATLIATATSKRSRAAARKQELRALYARLAQLQESDDDEDNQQAHDTLPVQGEVTPQSLMGRGELTAPQGVVDLGKVQPGLAMAAAHQQPVGGGSKVTGGQNQPATEVGSAGSHSGGTEPASTGQVWHGPPQQQDSVPVAEQQAHDSAMGSTGQVPSWSGGPSNKAPAGVGMAAVGGGQPPSWSGSSYNPTADLSQIYMERSLPLGDHLLQDTKAKIWQGEYVEMFTLLFRDVEVVLQAYPDRGLALVKYQNLIHRAYKEYNGTAWLHYDELFRAQAALDPTLLWDQEHQQLWSQCLGPAGAIAGRSTDSGLIVAHSQMDLG